jgi:serine/threonine protein kinase
MAAEDTDSGMVRRAEGRLGTVLRGKYRLERILGIGGMATVYAATHRNQKQFAVKILHPELSMREDIRRRFLREGYAANSVRHPGAVAVLDDDVSEDGAAFLVIELLEGASVDDLSNGCGGRLSLPLALAVAGQMLDVLAAAHHHGIVHRDIKPANVFVTRTGAIKVLDFGIARVRDATSTSSQATGAGVLLGTPSFMAPEQALGQLVSIDARTDVWAVAATIFALVSGRFVHEGSTASHLLVLAATAPARSLAEVAPGVPRAVVEVVDRGLQFRSQERWQSALEMREALTRAEVASFGRALGAEVLLSFFDDTHGLTATVPASIAVTTARAVAAETRNRSGRAPSRRRAWVLVTALCAVAGIGTAGMAWTLWRPQVLSSASSASPGPPRPAEPPARIDEEPEHAAPPAVASAPVATPLPVSSPVSVAVPDRAAVTAPQAPKSVADLSRAIAAAAPASPSKSASATPSAATPSPPNCNPPYFFDKAGNKVFKKDCL